MKEIKGKRTFQPEWKHICIILIYFVVFVIVFNAELFGGLSSVTMKTG
jgi:hypothetical protein